MAAVHVSIDLGFRDNEHLRAEFHRFANQINVIHAELQLLERMSGPDAGLRPSIRLCETATRAFKNAETAAGNAQALSEFASRINADLARVQVSPDYEADGREAIEIARSVLDEANLRVQELLARHRIPRQRKLCDPATVRSLVTSGAQDSAPSDADAPAPVGADWLVVDAESDVALPHGLPEAIGQLATELHRISPDFTVRVSFAPDAPQTTVTVNADAMEPDLIPDTPPSQSDPSDPPTAASVRIALIAYVSGPDAELTADPDGAPLLQIRLP